MAELVCDRARADLSAEADGDDVAVDEVHVASCTSCAAFSSGIRSLRSALRFEVLDDVPDVAPGVLAAIDTGPRRRPRLLPTAAAVLVGVIVGGAAAWPTGADDGIAAADLPARVVAAQEDVTSLAATLVVTEGDAVRRGTLHYVAPGRLTVELGSDRLVVDGGDLTALDLVLPASAFTIAAPPAPLGERTIDGRRAVGVRATAAQVGALLGGLRPLGVGTAVHPTDDVELWLDRDTLVPDEVVVRAAAGPDRARWAAARGLVVAPGDEVLAVRYRDLRVSDEPAMAPPGGEQVDAPTPAWLPDGMTRWRSSTTDGVAVQTWTDGRAWVEVRSTASWAGDRLFGEPGVVRVVRVGDGVAYVADGGDAVALHGDDVDVVVTGSIAPADLRRVAASLGVVGRRVPSTWAEASTVTVEEASASAPLLVVEGGAGFAPPSARVDGDTVTLTFAGAGERVVVLASRPGDALRPPSDPDAIGVELRGRVARWSPASADLEWVEDGRVWSMRSATVGLAELVELAEGLVWS